MQRGASHRDTNGKSQPDRTGDTQPPASRGPALRAWAASGPAWAFPRLSGLAASSVRSQCPARRWGWGTQR